MRLNPNPNPNWKVSYATAEARCKYAVDNSQPGWGTYGVTYSGMMCANWNRPANTPFDPPYGYLRDTDKDPDLTWLSRPCTIQAQVDYNGHVSLVHDASSVGTSVAPEFKAMVDPDKHFNVQWENGGAYPKAADNCAGSDGSCTVFGSSSTCLCTVTVNTTTAFASMPTLQEVSSQLLIGSAPPNMFDIGDYVLCGTADCISQRGVEAWVRVLGGGVLDGDTVFKIRMFDRDVWLANKASKVSLGGGYRFRQPPYFMPHWRPTNNIADEKSSEFTQPQFTMAAEDETQALLDHLLFHPNTAPFIAHRLIQRLTVSNPSPRYVKAVTDAFHSGAYGNRTYSGRYGDLGATVAAILLDREARAEILDADPTYGRLREPLLKVLHLMRSLEYTAAYGQEVELHGVMEKIGMQYAESPSVFNFYLAEYQPEGLIAAADLTSPEAELQTAPYLLGYLNGISSLIKWGLTGMDGGFSQFSGYEKTQGRLTWEPTAGGNTTAIVEELNLLLTGGRLNQKSRQVIIDEYDRVNASDVRCAHCTGPDNALRMAQQLFAASTEFHATNENQVLEEERPSATSTASTGKPFKVARPALGVP